MHASTIITTTVRVAGEIPTDIAIAHVGAPEQEASVRLGELLVYVRDPDVAGLVAGVWRQSRPMTGALPPVAAPSRLHLPVRVGLVGMIARLGGRPPCTAGWVAGRAGVAEPPHLRIQTGPVVWQVCDQAAWQTVTCAWTMLHRQLAAARSA